MKTLTIREVPDEVYAVIRESAEKGHRSIQEQVRFILAKEARFQTGGAAAVARNWRMKLAGRKLGDSVADIRAGRDRS